MTPTPETGTARAMINAGEISPDVTLLINDSGRFVLRTADQCIEVDGDALAKALARTKPVADLVARSVIPISGMSAPIERSLAKFGCALEEPDEQTCPRCHGSGRDGRYRCSACDGPAMSEPVTAALAAREGETP